MSRFKKKPAGIKGGPSLSSNGLVRLAGVAALAVGSVGGIVIASSAAYAATAPAVTSSAYTVGTGAVTGFTVMPGSNYVVSFKATDGVSTSSGSAAGTVSVSLPGTTITNGTTSFASGVSALVSVNGSQVGFATLASTTGASQATLTLPTVVSSGDTVQIEFIGVSNPPETSATPETGTLFTSNDPLTVDASYTIPQSSVAFAASASSSALGVSNVTYGVGPIDVTSSATGLGASSTAPFVLTFTPATSTDGSVTLPGAVGQYTVSVTSPSGTKSTDAVTGVTPLNPATGASSASLVLTTPLVSGDTVNVTITGAINPSTSGASPVTVSDSGNSSDSATIDYGSQIGSLTTSLMPPTTSSSGSATVNLVTSFVATDAIALGGNTTISLPSSITIPSSSTTAAVTVGSGSSATTYGEPVTTGGVVTMPSVSAGQQVTITIFSVKVTGSPGANSYSISVFTSADSLPATATATEDFTVTPGSVPVVLSNSALQATSNYSISGLEATAAIPADTNAVTSAAVGTASGDSELELIFPTGTSLPTSASDYTITDSTNSTGSGQASSVLVSGTDVYLNVSDSIAQGDVFSVGVNGAINPKTASNAYTIGINGNVEAAPVSITTVPTAATTYPNGALIQSGGQIDVVAGGHAFGIPSPTVFGKIRAMDKSGVVAGSFPTASAPAPGTLINPVGTSGYWVVGTNGDVYQFSSMSQFMKDGYITSQVIPVPNTGGLTAGAGAPPTAANTMANGALVQFGSTIYEYAGGIATGIATPAELAAIQKVTGAMVVMGSGSTPTSASTSANGTLVQLLGKAGVWVSNSGTLYQFMSASQFTTDGYSFQYVLPVAMTGSYTLSSI